MKHTATNCTRCSELDNLDAKLRAIRPGVERVLQDGTTRVIVTSVFGGKVGWRSLNTTGTTPLHVFATTTRKAS